VEFAKFRVPEFEMVALELDRGFGTPILPFGSKSPGVPEPDSGKDVEWGVIRAVIGDGDFPEDVVGGAFRNFLLDIEKAVFLKDTCILELIFAFFATAPAVFRDQVLVRVAFVGVTIEGFRVGVGGGAILVIIALLDVFPVVPLGAGESEESLLEDGVLGVPQGDRETETALAITPPLQAVFTPAIGTAAGVIMGEGFPAASIGRIVLANRAPLTFRQVGTPPLPIGGACLVFSQTLFFVVHGRRGSRMRANFGD
jgi:hypothetical protein